MLAEPSDAFDQVRPTKTYRSQEELDMRVAVDAWGRTLWPEARVVHELVMDRGKVRADMAFVSRDHLVSIEIKSGWDDTSRVINQVCMFRLATPETWLIVEPKHLRDAKLIRYLLPSVGIAEAVRQKLYGGPFDIVVVQHPTKFRPDPEALLSLLWVAELHDEAVRAKVWQGKAASHAKLVRAMTATLSEAEQLAAVCRQLRARNALWRADPVIAA